MTPPSREESRAKIEQVVQSQVERYLKVKFERWSERVPQTIGNDVAVMMGELGRQLEDFAVEIDRIQDLFSSGEGLSDAGNVFNDLERDHARTAVSLLTLMLEDLGAATGAQLERGDWGSLAAQLIGQALLSWVVVAMFGFIALPVFLVAEAFLIQRPIGKFREIMLNRIGRQIHDDLEKLIPTKREHIVARVREQFSGMARSVAAVLQSQIDETRAEQDRILHQKQDQGFSVEQERGRLDSIGARLVQLVDTIAVQAQGERLTPTKP
ncbi:MAG: hypothetical protein ACR2PL_28170 [Dehalococcoidia bacterium]